MSGERAYALRYSALCVKDVEGWLVKEGRSLRARRSRYVRLRGATLSSHRTKNAPASWEISVTNATVARGTAHEWHILLDLPNKHVSFIAAARPDFEEWIYALRRASLFSSRVEDYYRVRHIVGEGMNGKVRLGNDIITDETVAIKTVPRLGRANEDDFLAREVQIMLSMDHPNIVRTFDIFVRRKRIHFVMEYVPGGELFDLVAANTIFTEPRAASVMRDLLRAVGYLHTRGIAHRDVKLENLLCMRNTWPLQVKLADFGFANHIRGESDKMLSSFVGTPYYIAPEMLLSKGHGRPVDIWACGVVMYILLSGKFPFGGETEKEYYSRVLSREAYFPSQEWASVSQGAKDLVAAMLCKDPSKRLTAEECLNHPWILNASKELEVETRPSPPGKAAGQRASMKIPAFGGSGAETPATDVEKERTGSALAERFRRKRSKAGRNQSASNLSTNPNRRSRNDLDVATPAPGEEAAGETTGSQLKSTLSRQKLFSSRRKVASLKANARQESVGDSPQRECSPPPRPPLDGAGGQRESNAARPGNERLRQSGNMAGRRHSLIRRLLSSTRNSLDNRYETRHASFSGADAEDEATALPRKTSSLFGKLGGPIRRSFHRGPDAENAGTPFVNSQTQPGAQRLPPKLAREQSRQAAQERKAARRAVFRFRRGSTAGSSMSNSVNSSGPPTMPDSPGLKRAASSHRKGSRAQSDNSLGAGGGLAGLEPSRIMSDATMDRLVSDVEDANRPGKRSLPRRVAQGRGGADGVECAISPLSTQQMSIILGYDEDESNGSLQPSSGSTFGGFTWGTPCGKEGTQNELALTSGMMSSSTAT